MPRAGEARLEVDGQTLLGNLPTCELTETDGEVTAYTVGAAAEQDGSVVDFGSNGGRPQGSENWTAESGVTVGGNMAPMSAHGSVRVSGSSLEYIGEFQKMTDDGSSTEDVGEARLSVTCS